MHIKLSVTNKWGFYCHVNQSVCDVIRIMLQEHMTVSNHVKSNGPALALGAFFIYSAHDAVNKALLLQQPDLAAVIAAVCLLSALLTYLFFKAKGKTAELRPHSISLMVLYVAFFVIAEITYMYVLPRAPLADVFVLFLTIPLVVAALSMVLLREQLTLRQGVALLSGFAAVVLASEIWRPAESPKTLETLTLLVALGHVLCCGLRNVCIKKFFHQEKTAAMMFWPPLITGIGFALYQPAALLHLSPRDYGLALLSAFFFVTATFCYIRAFQLGPVALAGATQYSQIAWAALFGWLSFAEIPNQTTFAGIGLILLSGWLLYGKSKN